MQTAPLRPRASSDTSQKMLSLNPLLVVLRVAVAIVALSTKIASAFRVSTPGLTSAWLDDHVERARILDYGYDCWRHEQGATSAAVHRLPLQAAHQRRSYLMMATKEGGSSGPPSLTTKNMGSYYRRPSAAIEKGGGFFVPGLQGYRLRLVFGGVMLGLLSLDGLPRPGMTNTQLVSTTMAALAALALLVQAFIEQRTEHAVQLRRDAIDASSSAVSSEDSLEGEGEVSYFDGAALGEELEARTRWAAEILLQLTPACCFVAFADDKLLARAGAAGGESDSSALLANASATASSGSTQQVETVTENAGSTAAVTVTRGNSGSDDEVMSLLPDICRQGVLCKAATSRHGGDSKGVLGTVLLGSTLRGAGVFSERDLAWFERVCAHLAVAGSSER